MPSLAFMPGVRPSLHLDKVKVFFFFVLLTLPNTNCEQGQMTGENMYLLSPVIAKCSTSPETAFYLIPQM